MKARDYRMQPRHQKKIKATEFLLMICQTEVKSAMRNADHYLASAYAEIAVLIQDYQVETRRDAEAYMPIDQAEVTKAAGQAGAGK